ncbi:hypothetical protein CMK18_23765 [Candidatus Poribacteria bacterium]|nr:hypothetical protein [Candidatus Poribacteria bacterium]
MAKGPPYYQRGSYDVWDFIRDQGLNFHLGNAIKYICRAGYKDSKIQDLEKAIHYLENELHHEENILIRSGEGIPIPLQPEIIPDERQAILSEESDRRGI